MSPGYAGGEVKNGGPGKREMYASIMMRFSPILKYQLAIDIHVISTVVAATAGTAQRIEDSNANRATPFLIMVPPRRVIPRPRLLRAAAALRSNAAARRRTAPERAGSRRGRAP